MKETKNTITFEDTQMVYMKRVKATGNGAYVGVPKSLVGKSIYILVPNEKEKSPE